MSIWGWVKARAVKPLNWILLGLAFSQVPALDGFSEQFNEASGLRTVAAWYVFAGCLVLVWVPGYGRKGLTVAGWLFLAAGSVVYEAFSPFWFFYAPITVGSLIAAYRVYVGEEVKDNLLVLDHPRERDEDE